MEQGAVLGLEEAGRSAGGGEGVEGLWRKGAGGQA